MYPPQRGGYRPPFEGRGPPPRPYPVPGYRDERSRPRPPFHPGYHEHGPADSYRRSPPRRRYPSPGQGGHRAGEYRRETSPRGSGPIDHNLVITVGNELTGPSGSAPFRHHDRDYPPRPEYERSRSRGRSRPQSRSPDRSRAKSQGRSKSRVRSKSRHRSQSRSPGRSRARSRGRSRSRSPDRSRARSRSRNKSHSPDRSRAKSRGRSKSHSPDRSRAKSRGRSKSRHRSKSSSRGRSIGRSHGRSASSSSSSSSSGDGKFRKGFRELETARRRKELEEMLSLPTKSILKKRNDSEDSPSLRTTNSPRGQEGSNISRVADQLLQAVKGMEPHMVASMLSELRTDPQMAHRVGLDAEIKEILHLLGGPAGVKPQEKADDIDDEEKFLYGDSEEPKPQLASEPIRHHGLDLYGDVTEEALYGDYPPPKQVITQTYGLPAGASPHLQAPPTTGEVDVRYTSRPSVSPDQNITVQVLNSAIPPGMEPLEEGERQALEEYEKIQDLLKTIGLDLGVTEISKMAARTKERLHGNKPPPKTPTRSRRYSSNSSDGSRGRRRRSHSSSSSSCSRSRSRGRGGNRGQLEQRRRQEELGAAQTSRPRHYAPKLPPPGYSQYGNYLPYMHQQWPPMYPPPTWPCPPNRPRRVPPYFALQTPLQQTGPELGDKGLMKTPVPDVEKVKVSEEQNNESQKQKVLEEREKLKQERDIRMKKKEYLMKELERLRKQQGELLRKKRREKGGHKDPLLQEISHLQEDVMAQISSLRKEHEAAEKNRNEIEKIALILGLIPSDRPRRAVKPPEDPEDEPPPSPPEKKKKCEVQRSPEGRQAASSSSTLKQTSAAAVAAPTSRASPDEPPADAPTPPPEPFEYYDAGNHWCKNCNVTSGSMFDYFTHLHSKTHRKTLDPYDRPWASTPTKISKNLLSEEKLTKPAKGSEFLLPVRGFFCLLCKQFYGDAICAEEHVTTHAHNEKYKKQMYENPLYEQRRNLDRQAGLASEPSGKKRKHEDEDKSNKDEKSKHKKEKRDKEKKKEESDAVQKEEKIKKEGEEAKPSKKEEELRKVKSLEEDRPLYSKKDEEEKLKCSKKDDKYCSSREEEERGKHSRKDEDDRYKYREEECRSRYRREEEDRYDNRLKYGPRDEYKYGQYSDFRSKHDEGKLKAEKEAFKKLEPGKPAGKPDTNKPEPPPKPYDPPKILCGPSPAMRAKLRKQSLETSKPPPPPAATTAPSFGKFTWKKKESILAKEAEKVAAEFIKEDEAAAKQNPVSAEDSFAKSMAVAKEIAHKLGGHNTTPPWVYNRATRGRIRPNLPAPAAVLRKTAMMGKPAPLNTFLSIIPQNTGLQGTAPTEQPLFCDGLTRALNAQNALLENKPQPPSGTTGTFEAMPPPPVSRPAPPVSRPAPPVCNPAPLVSKPAPPICNPAPPVSKPAPIETKPAPYETMPAPSVAKSAQHAMIKIVSDVAAPGVPEGEQTRTVFVKPPPFMIMGDGPHKSEKLRSNLAAAKAQDLFNIFYSRVDQSGASSITKPATDASADGSSSNKIQLLTTQAPKPQPQLLTTQAPKPQPQLLTTQAPKPQPDSPIPQTPPEPVIQIESVWSLQPSQTPTHRVAPSETQPELNLPAQSETAPQNQSLTPKSESQTKPAELEPTSQMPKLAPQIITDPKPDQDTQPLLHLETHPDTVPEPAPKPGPKTRGKATPTKRTPPTTRPVRQTRSQTRYQTRQQQSQSEPEPASGDSDSAASDPKGVDSSDPGSGLLLEEGTPSEGDPPMMEITAETLGLPADMTSLDFDYDFNFE
ncbi:LOW QUALITY PROTEIN: zinc finger protein 318 [Anoplopoma fimbria]|uniref:LOW QUALITY PROTEIN: zinc finger protein 318 n=1 Tax=Anoplopoma fimbria TaxID=229290 RepID=UPI0023EB169A|nr:LOW QUALITY PROTEIN: zinc finger protein 318 [Anoplopoma fimbria]